MARGDPALATVREAGHLAFHVKWSEPVELSFESRFEAEYFIAYLNAIGRTSHLEDGRCGPCAAHHATGHDCPSCGASLALRVAPEPDVDIRRPPVTLPGPDQFLIPREQHRIRAEIALRARQKAAGWWLAQCDAADLLNHAYNAGA